MSVPASHDGPSKRTLYCPGCGHESATDGDWNEREREVRDLRRRVLSCPVCGTAVVSQPVLAAPA